MQERGRSGRIITTVGQTAAVLGNFPAARLAKLNPNPIDGHARSVHPQQPQPTDYGFFVKGEPPCQSSGIDGVRLYLGPQDAAGLITRSNDHRVYHGIGSYNSTPDCP